MNKLTSIWGVVENDGIRFKEFSNGPVVVQLGKLFVWRTMSASTKTKTIVPTTGFNLNTGRKMMPMFQVNLFFLTMDQIIWLISHTKSKFSAPYQLRLNIKYVKYRLYLPQIFINIDILWAVLKMQIWCWGAVYFQQIQCSVHRITAVLKKELNYRYMHFIYAIALVVCVRAAHKRNYGKLESYGTLQRKSLIDRGSAQYHWRIVVISNDQ